MMRRLLVKPLAWALTGSGAIAAVGSEIGVHGDALVPLSVVGGLLVGAVGYGQLRQSVSAAHRRLDELTDPDGRIAHIDEKLDGMSATLTDIRVLVARIAPDER